MLLVILRSVFPKVRHSLFSILNIVIFILFLPFASKAQQNLSNKQDSLFYVSYYRAATELASENMSEALVVADSLLNNSLNSLQRIKSMMLLASLHQRQGSIEKALEYAFKAEALCKSEGNNNWTMRISGFISTTLRDVGLDKFARNYLKQTETLNQKHPSANIQLLIYQEKAHYFILDSNYNSALDLLNKSIEEINKLPIEQRTPVYLATSYYMIGDCYLYLKHYDRAEQNYKIALNSLDSEESELKGFLFSGMGQVKMHFQDYDSAFFFFEIAQTYAENSGNFNLRSKVYKGLSEYYYIKQNSSKSLEYSNKLLLLTNQNSDYLSSISNRLIDKFGMDSIKNELQIKYAILAISCLVIVILALLFYDRRKRKKIKERYKETIIKLRNHTLSPISGSMKPIEQIVAPSQIELNQEMHENQQDERVILKDRASLMSKETEERLLKELSKLEGKRFFLQKDITLSALAFKLSTNQKYLSYLIHEHKEMDFSNYINSLRINYILNKIKNESVYLSYKIAHLAEECGYSSHSKFTEVFKNHTGLLPSVFIAEHKRTLKS